MTETKVVKVTKRDNINSLLKRADLTDNERTYPMHELELIEKKNAYRSKADKEKSQADMELQNKILNVLIKSDVGITCSVISLKLAESENITSSSQKIRSMLDKLIANKLVENYKEKGASLFKAIR